MLGILLATALIVTGCSGDDDDEPSASATQVVTATATVGNVTAATSEDGKKTATLVSEKGSFTFIEDENSSSSAKSGTWTFTEAGKSVAKYYGVYSGDISQLSFEDVTLTLTVKYVLNDNYVKVTVESEKSFNFEAETTRFTATIPEVKTSTETAASKENAGKSDAELLAEAKKALVDGDYDSAISKFQAAYQKNPSDENKIYYALTELATLSTDSELTDLIRNKLGLTGYPASLNALFTKDWLKDYPEYERLSSSKFEKNASGDYVRVSGTPVNEWSENAVYTRYVLYDGDWVDFWRYADYTGSSAGRFLTDVKLDAAGPYLVYFSSYSNKIDSTAYQEKAEEAMSDYLYERDYESESENAFVKSEVGSYVRLSGSETAVWSNGCINIYGYKRLDNGSWTDSACYLTDYALSNSGNYLVYKSNFVSKYVENLKKQEIADYLYEETERYNKPVLGEVVKLPELKVLDWVKSKEYYKSTLIGTTMTSDTWAYLLYANIVSSHENGLNGTIDTLLSVIHKKSEAVKGIVDSLGSGKASISAELIEELNLNEILGEDGFDVGKTEMNVLVSALEGIDAVLNYVASYDLSGNIKSAEVDFNKSEEEILGIVNDCVTAKTLAVRDAAKMNTSKSLLVDSLSRLIASYEAILQSDSYPQAVKDTLKEFALYYDGAKKAKVAVENGGVLYIPQDSEATAFPTSASGALFGIDFGKIFTAGYFTKLIERSGDLEKLKFYYTKYEYNYSYKAGADRTSNETESEPTEITDLAAFFKETVKDAGYSGDSGTDDSGNYFYNETIIVYRVGILANREIITNALPGVETELVNKKRFVDLFRIR